MRPDYDNYFMEMARVAATRATCGRKHVGAVIVRDRNIIATGYNGSIRGLPHCDDAGHLMEDGHCVRTVHAEANALLQAAKHGTAVDGATIYVTASPCWPCFGLIANAGIRRVVFGEAYRAEDPGPKRVTEVAAVLKIELVALATFTEVASGEKFIRVDSTCIICGGSIKYVCVCVACKDTYRVNRYACAEHADEAGVRHERVFGTQPQWGWIQQEKS